MKGFTTKTACALFTIAALSLDNAAAQTPSEQVATPATLFATAHVTGLLEGHFNFTYTPGQGVRVEAGGFRNFTNTTLGAYAYHIHTNPIDNNANTTAGRCGAALAHLDPLNVTENLICDPDLPSYCQTGDLSGKHGKINATADGHAANLSYVDQYLRFYPAPFSLLGRSVVIHGFNKTRLACGNIISIIDGTSDASGQPTNQTSNYQTDYPSAAPPAPITSVALGVGTSINSAALSSAGLAVPPSMIPDSEAANIALTSQNGQLAVQSVTTTTFVYTSGAPLPTQAIGANGNAAAPSLTKNSGAQSTAALASLVYIAALALVLAVAV